MKYIIAFTISLIIAFGVVCAVTPFDDTVEPNDLTTDPCYIDWELAGFEIIDEHDPVISITTDSNLDYTAPFDYNLCVDFDAITTWADTTNWTLCLDANNTYIFEYEGESWEFTTAELIELFIMNNIPAWGE